MANNKAVQRLKPGGGGGFSVIDRARNAVSAYAATGSGLAALTEFVFPAINSPFGASSGWGWIAGLNTTDVSFKNVNAYNSSIVMACINWIVSGFREAIPVVSKINADGVETNIPNHKFVKFLKRPNPYYNFSKLISATLISYYLDGNGYWFKERADNGLGQTTGLYYIPHYMIIPRTLTLGNYIDYYEYNVNGQSYRLPPNRIVHFRNELDPYNPMSGRKILDPVLSEIFTDEEAARFIAALVKNTGIPGVIITPDTEKVEVTDEDADALKENYKRKFGGDNRGDVLVMNFAAKVTQMGFNPEQLQFKETRRLPEERVCAQFRIAPVVAGLGAGLDKSTYNNYEQAERHSYQSCLVPAWLEIADEIETQLLLEFTGGDTDYHFSFDYSGVQALKESLDALVTRNRNLWLCDGILRAELREATGFVVDEKRDNIFYSQTKPIIAAPTATIQNPVKRLLEKAKYLLKAGDLEGNLNNAFELTQEADVKDVIGNMTDELDGLYGELGTQAEKQALEGIDIYNPKKEADRLTNDIIKAIGLALILRAIWGGMGKAVEEEVVTSISLRLSITTEFWDGDAKANAKGLVSVMANSYETALIEQTKKAIHTAIEGAKDGKSVAQIAKEIKSFVSGKEMYPGVFKEGYDNAIKAGANHAEATRAGESKARRYRAKLIAETESRTFQNMASLEGFAKAGVDKVMVTDGDGCGWKNHEDEDKADGSIRQVADARKFALAHPNCKRRFYPAKK